MVEKVVSKCPCCEREALVEHCDSGRCGWFICRNKDCDAVLDLKRKRGHVRDPDPGKSARLRVALT